MPEDLFKLYFEYTGRNETPIVYHRWALTGITAALCGRRVWVPFGHKKIYPILYIIFVDSPASRKTTAINTYAKPLLMSTGYPYIGADRTSKEQWWVDLQDGHKHGQHDSDVDPDEDAWASLSSEPKECMLLCGEMADFMSGAQAEDFAMNLGNMWDAPSPFYEIRTRNVQSVLIHEPTVSLLGATTPSQLTRIFGTNAIASGFFSRILFIKSPRRRPKTRPSKKDPALHKKITTALKKIYSTKGEVHIAPEAQSLLDNIYHHEMHIPDMRLDYYYARREEQLYRICIVVGLLLHQIPLIDVRVVQTANTMLYMSELMMPNALGEYGSARSSDTSQIILDAAYRYQGIGISQAALYKQVSTYVDSKAQFTSLIKKLIAGGKLQHSQNKGEIVLFPNQEFFTGWPKEMIDFSLLHPEENPYDAGLLTKTDGVPNGN